MLTPEVVLYLVIVAGLAGAILARSLAWLSRARRLRRERVQSRHAFEAIPTETPHGDPVAVARKRGLDSIEAQFTVTRRTVVPLVVGVGVLLCAVPFLSDAPAAVVSLMAAAVTVLLGMAARPWLDNVIAGLVISTSRLVRIGDTILIDDHYGTVEDVTPTHTTIKVWDYRRYLVPNARMLQTTFLNYSLFDGYVWAKVEFWVAHESDLGRVEEIAVAAAEGSGSFSDVEPPSFWVMELAPEGVRCWIAAWVARPSDAWQLASDVRSTLVRELRRAGIETHLRRVAVRGSERSAPETVEAGLASADV